MLSRCPVALLTPMTRALFRRWSRARTFGASAVGDPERTPEFVAQAMEALEETAAEQSKDTGPSET